MNRNQLWKKVLIVVLVVLAAFIIYPPQQRLKPGLDLAGGTSLIYGIDTEGMDKTETKGLAERMIPILFRRIDPTGVANIVMKPQGDTRIEIQLPLASKDTRERRDNYQAKLDALQADNINLATITRSLRLSADERNQEFAKIARNDEQKQILNDLSNIYTQRSEVRAQRDSLTEQLSTLRDDLAELNVTNGYIDYKIQSWVKLDDAALSKELDEYIKPADDDKKLSTKDIEKKKLLTDYVDIYKKWAVVVNDLTKENGLNEQYEKAIASLSQFNINMDALVEYLDSGKSKEYVAQLEERFPDRKEKVQEFIAAYNNYADVRGRLDDPEDLKRMLKGAGVLEFRILPTTVGDRPISTELARAYVDALKQKGPKQASDNKYVWAEIENIEEWTQRSAIIADFADKYYVLASNNPKETMLHNQAGGWKLEKAYPAVDEAQRRAIGFKHDEKASKLFFKLTSNNLNRPLCILLDNVAISAPNIQAQISSSGIITGEYSKTEQDDMINKLNAGSLPARISEAPISEKTIGPTIGEEYRDKGIKAGMWGLGVVAVFMTVYYGVSGIIAVIALVLNILFVLAVMAFSGATFTLPGIAGLILTIGMAVDANVLIFERIREELAAGSSLRIAINSGYQKAFRTILDANVTTFITAVILLMVASEEIKGFATVLMIGILCSMFTALFVTRVIFDTLMAKGILKDTLKMRKLFSKPSFNWMGVKNAFFAFSALVIVAGLTIFFTRDDAKSNKYDIEFTGGTSVQINLKEGIQMDRIDIENKIHEIGEKYNSSGLMSAKVYSVGEGNNQFEINTTETNRSVVDVRFEDKGQTGESVLALLKTAAGKSDSLIKNIAIKGTDTAGEFKISTSQLPKSETKTLIDSAFAGLKFEASEPVIDEVVNKAVTEAFSDILERQENLSPTITSIAMISDNDIDENPELAAYISGLKIECKLDRPVAGKQLKERFKSLRFKKDMQDAAWYQYVLLDNMYTPVDDDKLVENFSYVSLHPDAGFRELGKEELAAYEEGENAKVMAATSLETSLPRVSQFNPSIGKESKNDAMVAIILSLIAIIAYIWIRFGDAKFGFAAIAALVHDVCITLGAVTVCYYIAGTSLGDALGIRDFKINLQMIAAFLTIIGYSLNDTIVVFDRIRENRGKLTGLTPDMITNSINQTLSRTILTSFTTFIVVLVMYIGGGIGLRGFTFAMLIGIIIGTYSSIAIASPILLIGGKKK